jgi:hypothetical protein
MMSSNIPHGMLSPERTLELERLQKRC